jgi:formamidopyrimidine-DNA glycosylase
MMSKEIGKMPELPEMETYRQLLSANILQKRIKAVEINREKSINLHVPLFQQELVGKQVTQIERRAKHLLFHLSHGKVLILHLMLGGWMYLGKKDDNPDRTKQIILAFSDNLELYFIGLRLGYLHLLTRDETTDKLAKLGPEPLSSQFTFDAFENTLNKRWGMLKPTLVDQKFLSGIGNCYSDEICFSAQLHPSKRMNELNSAETKQLFTSIKTVLERAIKLGGYMEYPLYKNDEITGGYENHTYVYDREGKPCVRCGTEIVKAEISSRKMFYCPNCQQ